MRLHTLIDWINEPHRSTTWIAIRPVVWKIYSFTTHKRYFTSQLLAPPYLFWKLILRFWKEQLRVFHRWLY